MDIKMPTHEKRRRHVSQQKQNLLTESLWFIRQKLSLLPSISLKKEKKPFFLWQVAARARFAAGRKQAFFHAHGHIMLLPRYLCKAHANCEEKVTQVMAHVSLRACGHFQKMNLQVSLNKWYKFLRVCLNNCNRISFLCLSLSFYFNWTFLWLGWFYCSISYNCTRTLLLCAEMNLFCCYSSTPARPNWPYYFHVVLLLANYTQNHLPWGSNPSAKLVSI